MILLKKKTKKKEKQQQQQQRQKRQQQKSFIVKIVAASLIFVVFPLVQIVWLDEYIEEYIYHPTNNNTTSTTRSSSETTTAAMMRTTSSSSSSFVHQTVPVSATNATTAGTTLVSLSSSSSCKTNLSLGPLIFTNYSSHYNHSDFLKGKGLLLLSGTAGTGTGTADYYDQSTRILGDDDNDIDDPKQEQQEQQHSSSTTSRSSICKYFYKGKDSPHHFPHTMQIMYRCWSWWQSNNNLPSSTENSNDYKDDNDISTTSPSKLKQHYRQQQQQNLAIFWVPSNWTIPYLTEHTPYPYNRGFFNALQQYANVTIQIQPPKQSSGVVVPSVATLSSTSTATALETNNTKKQSNHTTTTMMTTYYRSQNNIVRPYLHPNFPYQGQSPDHFHTLRDIFLLGINENKKNIASNNNQKKEKTKKKNVDKSITTRTTMSESVSAAPAPATTTATATATTTLNDTTRKRKSSHQTVSENSSLSLSSFWNILYRGVGSILQTSQWLLLLSSSSSGQGKSPILDDSDTIATHNNRVVSGRRPGVLFPRIAIVNRVGSRQLLNAKELAQEVEIRLSHNWVGMDPHHHREEEEEEEEDNDDPLLLLSPPSSSPPPKIRITSMEGWSFEEQIHFFSTIDILISPHGAQLTSLPFLPNDASVLEIFPLGYEHHIFFGTLAAMSGVEHAYTYLTNGNRTTEVQMGMINLPSRIQRRQVQLCLTPLSDMVDFILIMIQRWQKRKYVL